MRDAEGCRRQPQKARSTQIPIQPRKTSPHCGFLPLAVAHPASGACVPFTCARVLPWGPWRWLLGAAGPQPEPPLLPGVTAAKMISGFGCRMGTRSPATATPLLPGHPGARPFALALATLPREGRALRLNKLGLTRLRFPGTGGWFFFTSPLKSGGRLQGRRPSGLRRPALPTAAPRARGNGLERGGESQSRLLMRAEQTELPAPPPPPPEPCPDGQPGFRGTRGAGRGWGWGWGWGWGYGRGWRGSWGGGYDRKGCH